ncbi:hypothetical protein LCGC14_3026650 [marine sediment metagenome]|uniref:ArnR1-like winged helix-turn-helix domain-containing protein n=1 Tax=marine sediment metagenome TaxID=412755 RepID=A0A0F8Z187_9ZZZZ
MLKQKRNKLEIIKDLLEFLLSNKDVSTTVLIAKINLCRTRLDVHEKILIRNRLIKLTIIEGKKKLSGKPKTRDHRVFNITKRGKEYLEKYKEVELFLEKYGLNED